MNDDTQNVEAAPEHSATSTINRHTPISVLDPEVEAALEAAMRAAEEAMAKATTQAEMIAAFALMTRDPVLSRNEHWSCYTAPPETKRERAARRAWNRKLRCNVLGDRGTESVRERRARERVELRSRRDEIRAQQHQSHAPPDPLLGALDHAIAALVALKDQIESTKAAPKTDEWVTQTATPLPPRCHCKLARELLSRGDDRAAVRGRVHYLRQSAIDGHLRGAPRPKRKPDEQLDAGSRLLAELGGRHG